jgi:ribosomal protein S27E
VTLREASCPGCGATLVFRNAATLYVVCPHCGGASARTDVALEDLGRVAQVSPVPSVLSLGAEGRHEGRRWRAVGLLQLDHGKGPWNEWCLAFEDDGWAWLAEAQGELLLTRETSAQGVRGAASLVAGAEETIDGVAHLVVERGEARVVAAQGELPVRARPGTRFAYADLRGPDGRFATVSDGPGPGNATAAFAGRVVSLEDLGIDAGTVVPPEPVRVSAARLACPSCGDSVDVLDPRASVRVVCPSCGKMLDPREGRLRVLGVGSEGRWAPAIPIGSLGVLAGRRLRVLGFLVRSVRADGVWRWREYLLRDEDGGGYRWLVESDGHWNLTEPASPADLSGGSGRSVVYRGERFRFFQAGDARVDEVQGEAYWEVTVGETVKSRDYVAPPLMLSIETTPQEKVVSIARYVPSSEVAAGFGVERLPPPEGVAPNEPNPHVPAQHWRAFAGLAAAGLLLLLAVHVVHDRETLHREARTLVVPAAPSAYGAALAPPTVEGDAFFTPDLRLDPASGNVVVRLSAPVLEGWLGLDGSLVNLDTGEVRAFQCTLERWVEDAEVEESGDPVVRLGRVPAGRYALRFAPAAQARRDVSYEVVVRSQVPAGGRLALVLGLLLVVPLASSVLRARFESRRWESSDAEDPTVFGAIARMADES